MAAIDADRNLLFGLLALQIGLIDQAKLVAAFQAWTLQKARPMAEHLVARGDLDDDDRAAVEALVVRHLKKHGGSTEKSLAAIPAGRSARASLADLGDPEVEATLGHLGTGHALSQDDEADAALTATHSVGSATSEGQRFRILRPHARGGLGAVFVALDAELHREVALKQILDRHADDPTSRTRFVLEAEITGGLEHPGIVPVYGLGSYGDGRPYYAMRFVRGDSLKDAIAAFHADVPLKGDPGRRSLEVRKLFRRFTDVCNAIEYAHSRGVLHRDIKPANVIVGKHGETLVVDWGLAKALGKSEPGLASDERTLMPSSASGTAETLPGSAMGTPAYMSPEQARGDLDHLSPRSDVYSLGATLYCILTGKLPFEGDDLGAVLRAVQKGNFPSPRSIDVSIDRALEAVCLKAMATQPDDRYATPKALAEDVERWMADEPVTAWREPRTRTMLRWLARHRVGVTAVAAAMLVALVGTAAVLAVQTRANAELKAANDKVTRANTDLAASNQRERERFNLAQEAIRMFHTGVSEDLLLKQKEFGALRTKLLRGAQEFYRKLERLLGGQADRESRRSLGRAYYEVGELTMQLDSMADSLAMHQRALALFEKLAGEAPTDAELQGEVVRSGLALALRLLSNGQKAEALAGTGRARAVARVLAEADPDDLGRRGELARVEHLHGELLLENARADEGLSALKRARAIQEDLVRISPSDENVRLELARTCDSLASRLDDVGRRDEALVVYGRARELGEDLFRTNPTDAQIAHELVRTLGNMGIALQGVARPNESLAAYDRARQVLGAMADANPTLLSVVRDRAWIDLTAVGVLIGRARDAEALPFLEAARKARETLVKADETVVRDQMQLIRIHYTIIGIHTRAGRVSEARASCESLVAVASRLADAHPADLEYQSQLARVYKDVAEFYAAIGRLSEASPRFDKAIAIHRRRVETDRSQSQHRRGLADVLRSRAIVLQKYGRPAEAVSAFREAIRVLEGLSSPRSVDIYDIACNQSLLSRVACAAGSRLTPATGQAEADKAIESLRRAIAAGWNRPDHMRIDTDLDPLRSRPDFQLLLMDLAFPSEPFASGR